MKYLLAPVHTLATQSPRPEAKHEYITCNNADSRLLEAPEPAHGTAQEVIIQRGIWPSN